MEGRKSTPAVAGVAMMVVIMISLTGSAAAYKNYTVGDTLGWYDLSEKPTADYQKWADSHNFSLGDFLFFNTNTNHSVIQSYNLTTYQQCDYDNSQEADTVEWASADPSNTATVPVTIAVPLVKEGPTFFFSGDYDGDQCRNGQQFKIAVAHGQGLPESLKPVSKQAPAPNSDDVNNEDSAPDTTVTPDFSHPKGGGGQGSGTGGGEDGNGDDDGDDKKTTTSSSLKSSGDRVTVSPFKVVVSGVWVLLGVSVYML